MVDELNDEDLNEDKSDQNLDVTDYYFNEEGLMVFTEKYLLNRGYCCEKGCKHCPYGFENG